MIRHADKRLAALEERYGNDESWVDLSVLTDQQLLDMETMYVRMGGAFDPESAKHEELIMVVSIPARTGPRSERRCRA